MLSKVLEVRIHDFNRIRYTMPTSLESHSINEVLIYIIKMSYNKDMDLTPLHKYSKIGDTSQTKE
jgi:hypothetical protein